jgi:proteasome lid subunit RPN8/RPN11
MTRKGLLQMKLSGTGMRLVLSLTVLCVWVVGCQVPPAPAASAQTPSAVSQEAAAPAEATYASQVQQEKAAATIPVQPVPEKTEEVRALPVAHLAVTQPEASTEVPAPLGAQPVVAAVHMPVEDEDPAPAVPLDTQQEEEETESSPPVVVETAQASVPPSPDAKIYVVEKVFDFGEVTPLDTPKGTFQIKNIGTATLYVTKVTVCCGAQHTLSSEILAPGESSVLSVMYRSNSVGPFEKYLTVFSNDASSPDVKLTIKGSVVRHLKWTPDRFKLFLDQENGGCLPIKITSTDGKPFALSSFAATEDCLTATVDPDKEATEFVLMPKVDLKKLGALKMPKGVVRIKHTHPGCDTILLNYDLVKRYAFSPQRFLVLNADPKQVRTQRLNILDNYADSLKFKAENQTEDKAENKDANKDAPAMFTIEGVACQKESAVLKSVKQITDGYQLTFEITPPDPAGQRLFQDLIAIMLSTGDELIIPVNGIYSMAALSAAGKQE